MAEYPLRIKASIDTSQVERQLKNIKHAPSLSGGGEKGQAQANKEITAAAQKINLGALASGFNRVGRQLEGFADKIGGVQGDFLKGFSSLSSTVGSITRNFQQFGGPLGSLVTALQIYAEATAIVAEKQQKAAAAMMEISEIRLGRSTENVEKQRTDRIKNASVEELQESLASANARVEGATRRRDKAEEEVILAQETLHGNSVAVGARAGAWMRRNLPLTETLGIGDELANSENLLDSAKKERESAEADLQEQIRIRDQYAEALARATEARQQEADQTAKQNAEQAAKNAQRQDTLATQTENIIAARSGELSLRKDVESGDIGALQSRFESVQQNIATLENMGPLSEGLQSLLKESYSMQDYLTGVLDDLAPDRTGETEEKEEEEKEEKELPSWLDGMDARTDDWFHSIGGSVGGENIQNQELQLMQEMTRLVRSIDQTQTQMNRAIQ